MNGRQSLFAILITGGLSIGFAADPSDTSTRRAVGKAVSCSPCHGPDGNGGTPHVPRLAGQSAAYLAAQLRLFRSGERKSSIMKPAASALTDQDIDDLAAYYQTQAPAPDAAASATEERTTEQLLRLQGYRATENNGETLYCRREAPLGSRLATTVHCVTPAEAELIAQEGRETTERIQRSMTGCLNAAAGGCGK